MDGANNFLGHGFYQFSPELLWRAFSSDTGWQVDMMYLAILGGTPTPRMLVDPKTTGARDEIRSTPGPTYLMMVARKLRGDAGVADIQQSDYQATWDRRR